MLAFNTPFFPEILIASSVLAEGVDLHLDCRFVVHHDLSWNPSTIEQRTGRVDRIGSKAERAHKSIHVYLPFVTATHDEKMFRVVRDRERWFSVVMGEKYELDEATTDKDLLDAGRPALRFAKLLTARDVNPPIALGLFGNWGAGKTFFIPAGTVHNATNRGSTRARVVATYIVEKGKPLLTLAK